MFQGDIEETPALLQQTGLQLGARGEAGQEDELVKLLRRHQALGLTQLSQDLPLKTEMGGLDKLEYYFENTISDTISKSMPRNFISGLYTPFGIIQIIPPDGLSS